MTVHNWISAPLWHFYHSPFYHWRGYDPALSDNPDELVTNNSHKTTYHWPPEFIRSYPPLYKTSNSRPPLPYHIIKRRTSDPFLHAQIQSKNVPASYFGSFQYRLSLLQHPRHWPQAPTEKFTFVSLFGRVTKSLLLFEPKSRLGIDGIVTSRPFLSSLVPQFQNESLGLGPLGLKNAKRFKWRWVWFAWKWTCRRNSFSYEWFCVKTRFDTEAKSRSKMAYWNAPYRLDGGS